MSRESFGCSSVVWKLPLTRPRQWRAQTLHHLLPKLVVPIDRTSTAPFLFRCRPEHLQTASGEKRTFAIAFKTFSAIAQAANPGQYVNRGSRWNTSVTKVIDNSIVGFMRWQMSLE